MRERERERAQRISLKKKKLKDLKFNKLRAMHKRKKVDKRLIDTKIETSHLEE